MLSRLLFFSFATSIGKLFAVTMGRPPPLRLARGFVPNVGSNISYNFETKLGIEIFINDESFIL